METERPSLAQDWTDRYLSPNPENLNLTYGFGLMEKDLKLSQGFTNFDIDRTRKPHIVGDFRYAPFRSGMFKKLLFDPPHLTDFGTAANHEKHGAHPLVIRYGGFKNVANMKKSLYLAFREILRMLAPGGICIFKWNEYILDIGPVIRMTPQKLRPVKTTPRRPAPQQHPASTDVFRGDGQRPMTLSVWTFLGIASGLAAVVSFLMIWLLDGEDKVTVLEYWDEVVAIAFGREEKNE
jgi:hypothetical protein